MERADCWQNEVLVMLPADDVTLGEIARGLLRMEAKLDMLTADHERRLRQLERWMYALPPTIAVAIASVVAAIFR
jgi:hypothetical protein